MDDSIAKGALNTFSQMVFSGSRISRSNITIGFYGGEPLLKFDLIKKIVDFSKLVKDEFGQEHDWSYRFATNGYLLTPPKTDYFVTNNFFIDISIDGSEQEHDKFRVLKTGSPTWNAVWDNVVYIKKKFPDYFNRNVKFQISIHPDHKILQLEKFLKYHNDIFNENNTSFSVLKMHGLEGDLLKSWISKYNMALEDLRNLDKKFWLLGKLHPEKIKDKFSESTYILKLNDKFTGNCFPGEVKVYVNTDGRFSICEKIYPGNYIGDYINGFNFDTIEELEKKWNKLIRERSCWQCNHWYFCNACYVRCEKQGDFVTRIPHLIICSPLHPRFFHPETLHRLKNQQRITQFHLN